MNLSNLITIWKKKGQILEGIRNSIFKKEHVEEIAAARLKICESNQCESYDPEGSGCMVPGTAPCCNMNNGGCGCSLTYKLRVLSEGCPKGWWGAELSEEEEQALTDKLAEDED